MSRHIENDCVGCPPHMGCMGSSCPYRNALYIECDNCEDDLDTDTVYEFDGKDYCEKCARELYPEEFEDDEDD